jgi:hypothetical protein
MPGYIKIGWKRQQRLRWWTRPWPLAFSKTRLSEVDQRAENTMTTANSSMHFIKDAEYIEWRYRCSPHNSYTFSPLGTVNGHEVYAITVNVTRRGIKQVLLVDIVSAENAHLEYDVLLPIITKQVAKLGRLFTVLDSSILYSTSRLIRTGFIPLPKVGVNYVTYSPEDLYSDHSLLSLPLMPGDMDTF